MSSDDRGDTSGSNEMQTQNNLNTDSKSLYCLNVKLYNRLTMYSYYTI